MDETLKNIERRSLNRAEAMKEGERPNPRPKEGRSAFDELLEQSRSLSEQAARPKLQQKTAAKDFLHEADKFRERQRERHKDSEEKEEQRQDAKGERREGQAVGKKVVGKSGLKRDQGDAGGGNSQGRGLAQKKGATSQLLLKKTGGQKGNLAVGSNEFARQFQNRLQQAALASPKTVPQDILNQVIRYARLGISRDGTKIFELECRQEIFAGLRLRFQTRHGKVNIEFLTAKAEVKNLFEKEIPFLQEALTQKGIAVDNITVS